MVTTDGDDFAKNLEGFQNQWQDAMSKWMSAWTDMAGQGSTAPKSAAPSFPVDNLNFNPEKIMQAQLELMRDTQALWLNTAKRFAKEEAAPVIEPGKGDRRFNDPAWSENPVFEFLKQSYLLNSRWLFKVMEDVEGLDKDGRQKLEFFGRQLVDMFSPTNFALTNPTVLSEMNATKGESLMRGMKNLTDDLGQGRGGLRPRHTDMDAFQVGENIGITKGSVVYQNPFMQLIQYAPRTEKVHKKPLLIVPPWINKFYILDLQEENSLVSWLAGQGYTVFIVSWVNPDESFAEKSFDDYAAGGIFQALDAIEQATGERQVTAVGYCIGGTILAAVLAHMAEMDDDRISAATFLVAQVDFEDAGELRVFTDENQLALLENQVKEKGYLEAEALGATFNALRANDLIWYFMINNYLLGKEPPTMDLLYWNADSTRFPARMLLEYLRTMYQHNLLAQPGGFELLGTGVDLRKIKIPTYIHATKEDHIAPAISVFKGTNIFSGQNRFVLAGSGHIAGVVNSPAKNKYQYWVNGKRKSYEDLAGWLTDAEEKPGSWWPDWHKWLGRKSGAKVPARNIGDGALAEIEPAPGSYVKVRS